MERERLAPPCCVMTTFLFTHPGIALMSIPC
jgi:hypothetical protein